MKDKKIVDGFFRVGIPALMNGFNPWEFSRGLKTIKKDVYFKFAINSGNIAILEKLAENLEKVAAKYFEGQPEEYDDPCDQCFEMKAKHQEIFNAIFEGIEVNEQRLIESEFIFNLFYGVKGSLDNLMLNIESWCIAHKFMEEVHGD